MKVFFIKNEIISEQLLHDQLKVNISKTNQN